MIETRVSTGTQNDSINQPTFPYLYTFTVFTPTYNRAHTLHRVYESLNAQTFRDFEWLIVDDGSNDGTAELVAIRDLQDFMERTGKVEIS